MGDWSAYILCPFYRRHNGRARTITCEGILRGSDSGKTHFESSEALRRQLAEYCAGDFRNCPWGGVLWEKYENE